MAHSGEVAGSGSHVPHGDHPAALGGLVIPRLEVGGAGRRRSHDHLPPDLEDGGSGGDWRIAMQQKEN
jgi:hypothetical protein